MGLPAGTVTLLFSDIEGSTRMVLRLGDTWVAVLEQHRALCREAWMSHGGHELGTEGDSFFVAFHSAGAAASAAVAAQQALLAAPWPPDVDLRVRMGLHTGTPTVHRDGYVGMDVHRAARIAGAAHGRQVLLSEATAERARPDLEESAALLDLGLHHLRDIPEPIRLYQLSARGMPARFAPLKSRGGAGSLPAVAQPLVGREREVARLREMVSGPHPRLVTLTGPGGSGKTTLATIVASESAPRFADGVYFVSMVDARTDEDMWTALAGALELPADAQTTPRLFDHVAGLDALVVLDNLEQVGSADRVVAELLAHAPLLTLLTTSRRPLHVSGEVQHAVAPLVLPQGSSFDEIAGSAAVQMFVAQARRIRDGFDLTGDNAQSVAALCVAVDGLPLGIELVAARSKMWSPKALVARLNDVDDLASPDKSRPARQRTVRAAIAWSFDLLSDPARRVAVALGVFEGGATLEDVEAVVTAEELAGCAVPDVLFELVDASLVVVDDTRDRQSRFHLLETVRRYALGRARAAGVSDSIVQRHAQRFYEVAASYESRRRAAAYTGLRAQFLGDLANLRAVVARGARGIADPSYGDDPVPFAHTVALVMEQAFAFRCFAAAVSLSDAVLDDGAALEDLDPAGAASILVRRARLLTELGQPQAATVLCGRAARLARQALLAPTWPSSWQLPRWVEPAAPAHAAMFDLAYAYQLSGDLDRSRELCAELLQTGASLDLPEQGKAQLINFFQAAAEGDYEAARAFSDREGEIYVRNNDEEMLAMWVNNAAFLDLNEGNSGAARLRITAHLARLRELGDPLHTIYTAETFAIAIGFTHPRLCARLRGAAECARTVEGIPLKPGDAESDEVFLENIRSLLPREAWESEFRAGRTETLMDLMEQTAALVDLELDHRAEDGPRASPDDLRGQPRA